MKITRRQLRMLISEEIMREVGDPQFDYSEPDVGDVSVAEYLQQSKYRDWLEKIQVETDDEERRKFAHDFIADLSDDLYEQWVEVMDPDDGSEIKPWMRGRWDSEEAVTARRAKGLAEVLSDYLNDVKNKRSTETDYIQQVITAANGETSQELRHIVNGASGDVYQEDASEEALGAWLEANRGYTQVEYSVFGPDYEGNDTIWWVNGPGDSWSTRKWEKDREAHT